MHDMDPVFRSLSHAHHGPRTRQRLRCAVEELEFLDFGTIFTTQTCSREVRRLA